MQTTTNHRTRGDRLAVKLGRHRTPRAKRPPVRRLTDAEREFERTPFARAVLDLSVRLNTVRITEKITAVGLRDAETAERVRFDFSAAGGLDPEQQMAIERAVNTRRSKIVPADFVRELERIVQDRDAGPERFQALCSNC
ncbi:hypothetical protein IIA15_02200, partial [candidate division TA06 bacterium]|nr:hypothetical protein [candidate division TA06 bacterium]